MGSLRRSTSNRHRKKGTAVKMTRTPSSLPPPPPPPPLPRINAIVGGTGKSKKRRGGVCLWTRFDRTGFMEVVGCDKSTIIERSSVSAKDLRTGFSHSSKILAREKAIVLNLEVIKAVITPEEVMLLESLRPEVLTLIDRLKHHFPRKDGPENAMQASSLGDQEGGEEGLENKLPFEFQVLEIALEVVCSFVDSNVVDLETQAWSILDELTKKVTNENLKDLRSLKSSLTILLARVQKVRDEIEHFLDDKEDMEDLYLTRKCIQNQQTEAPSNSIVLQSKGRSASMVTEEDDVDDMEMLLEAYFMQLEGMQNKILMMKEHIDGTEAYVKILQNSRRNGLFHLMMVVNIGNYAITAGTVVVNLFGMNTPIGLYSTPDIFGYVVWAVVALCIVLFIVTLGYAKHKKLLD
ncbi:hypothetical protein ISN44_As12g012620 [Arabidopsis suecica]|uniref:Magnesium transporter n=1 Tax=Arabidopsis suecica TaxID=45249 RepID=A0A8T1YIF3_ARASU|nr:hypothetical protein ISN44_As12g012620 [Arabidopsis suecica]